MNRRVPGMVIHPGARIQAFAKDNTKATLVIGWFGLDAADWEVEAVLRKDEYEILSALNGKEAVELALDEHPDLILLDINMPGPSGTDVIRRIKDKLPQAKVIMLTVRDDKASLLEAVKSGADGFLSKSIRGQAGTKVSGNDHIPEKTENAAQQGCRSHDTGSFGNSRIFLHHSTVNFSPTRKNYLTNMVILIYLTQFILKPNSKLKAERSLKHWQIINRH